MIKASHGTPHKWESGKADMSKIGTGEGNQAYGHGIYAAEGYDSPVAKGYQRNLGDVDLSIGDKVYDSLDFKDKRSMMASRIRSEMPSNQAGWATNANRNNFDEAIAAVRSDASPDDLKILDGMLADGLTAENKGNLYNLNLNVEPEDLLDWDGGFSDQPQKLQKAWRDMWVDREPDGFFKNLDGSIDEDAVTGRMMYHEIADHQYTKAYVGENNLTKANAMNLEQEASKTLKEAGVPGIKYLDGTSRSAGEGTRNFVMFDEDLIEIADGKKILDDFDGAVGGGKVDVPPNIPDMSLDDVSKAIEEKHGLKSLHLYEKGDDITLSMIEVPKGARKQGKGTQAVQELVDYADSKGKRVILTPGLKDDLDGTTSRARLVKFYKKLGFIENKGRHKDFTIKESMYRNPE